MKSVFAILFGLALYYPICAYFGWCAATIWRWHAVPLGLPDLGWKTLVCASLLVASLRPRYPAEKPEDTRTQDEKIVATFFFFFGPLIAVGMAWVLK